MNTKHSELLIEIVANIQESGESSEPEINFSALVKAQLQLVRQTDPSLLERICRCIDVSKTLRTSYSKDWKKLESSAEAPVEVWIATIALLLQSGELALEIKSSDGHALKYLNSALKALDLCLRINSDIGRSAIGPTFVSLQLWANALLASAVTVKVAP